MIRRIIPKSDFINHVLTLMTGTTLAQFIPVLISPILTRLYSPKDFGLYFLFISIVSMIAPIAGLKYEMAIVLPKKQSDAVNILGIPLLLTVSITFMIFIVLLFFKNNIITLFNITELGKWLWFLPVLVFCYRSLSNI